VASRVFFGFLFPFCEGLRGFVNGHPAPKRRRPDAPLQPRHAHLRNPAFPWSMDTVRWRDRPSRSRVSRPPIWLGPGFTRRRLGQHRRHLPRGVSHSGQPGAQYPRRQRVPFCSAFRSVSWNGRSSRGGARDAESEKGGVKFPQAIRHRRVEAKIYGKSCSEFSDPEQDAAEG
jgi:hypothetical protein